MSYTPMSMRDAHLHGPGPKRILALDGGGLRGILTLGYLARIEELLDARFAAVGRFRLAHYFDLIAGTSTGAIIAAALARGLSVAEIREHYLQMGHLVFGGKQWFSRVVRDKYAKEPLEALLKDVLGADTKIGDSALLTGLLIVTKRCDTGSPWPIGNNPSSKYFSAPLGASWLSNGDYPLWQVVRASTAAPTYFEPEFISIGTTENAQTGRFVDGGVSPHNNPSLQAFMYATLRGYGLAWPTGENQLLVVSVGTGAARADIEKSSVSAVNGVNALEGLLTDNAALVETMMQWMSNSPTARVIDGEIGNLAGDVLGGSPQFTYLRYNVELTEQGLAQVRPGITSELLARLPEMDSVANLQILQEIGDSAAAHQIEPGHFDRSFDLTPHEA